jgi:hypothetical protein
MRLLPLLMFPLAAFLVGAVGPNTALAAGEPVSGFPTWEERVVHTWTNRARSDPQFEMASCPAGNCPDAACYSPVSPVAWTLPLSRAARFHSEQLALSGCGLRHTSPCTLVSNINALYPDSCDGSASCACQEGFFTCSPTGTDPFARLALFGVTSGSRGENAAGGLGEPDAVFYLWLHEASTSANCGFTIDHGHRWNILNGSYGSHGAGFGGPYWTTDFGPATSVDRVPSGAHYPRQAATVELWANWFDTAGPSEAVVNVEGTCSSMALERGSATNGAWRANATGVGTGCHRYVFEFRAAGGEIVTYPTTGSFGIGPAGSCADWDVARPAPCLTSPAVPSIHPIALYVLLPGLLIGAGVLALRLRS